MDWAISEKSYTQRKACDLVGLAPKVYRYQSVMPDDTGLRQRLRELASQRRRFGYRRLHLLLEREGVRINWKKLYRLYREEKLTVRKRPFRHLENKCLSGKGWPQTGLGDQGTDGHPARGQPALEPGLRVRCPQRWAEVPCSVRH